MNALDRLVEGYRKFRHGFYEANRDALLERVRRGQSPGVCVVGCSDSRVDPTIILGAFPGELFVIRNVANLVPPIEAEGLYHGTIAGLEFAVCELRVAHILVLGHSHCGGIEALMTGGREHHPRGGFLTAWMSIAAPARQEVVDNDEFPPGDARLRACEMAAIRLSLQNLRTFPWITERIDEGSLGLEGWYYELESGDLLRLDESGPGFREL